MWAEIPSFAVPTTGFPLMALPENKKKTKTKTKRTKKQNIKVKGVGKIWNASRICVSSLRRGHANLLCIVPILVYVIRRQRYWERSSSLYTPNFLIELHHRRRSMVYFPDISAKINKSMNDQHSKLER